ncbi:LOW QUALITY PROTEIN: KLK3 isoform 10 [Pongo abelii]|uniref:KLK3 isoform 10 n=1 Tax=Pongo abelii TaxID=9601 RepID=A0A2J8U914_PONAB|nr:LOW QUALITY PROTEIN: KLK3 isoform 10 [Pongo abelii]
MWVLVLFIALPVGCTGAAPLIQSRIVGGWECEKHSQPWQAAVYSHGWAHCGGVLVHPQWVLTAAHCLKKPDEDFSHDLMLLRLSEPAKITDAVKVLGLPTQEPALGTTCYASGWGSIQPEEFLRPKSLQCVSLHLLSNDMCARAYSEKVTEFMLCAGLWTGGKDTCGWVILITELTMPAQPMALRGSPMPWRGDI